MNTEYMNTPVRMMNRITEIKYLLLKLFKTDIFYCTFCLDTKSTKKIKADKNFLKLSHFAARKETSSAKAD